MAGVLVLAAGIPSAFVHFDYTIITVGYFIMRVGLVAQWVRAAIEHPEGRRTALRYAIAISVLQIGWWAKLFAPSVAWPASIVLIALELCIPPWAERAGKTSWHPHHIAERYGLFTIIVLGESVLASTVGLQRALESHGVGWPIVTVAIAGLVLLFALWWLYFLEPSGDGLEEHRELSFLWGYGHYWIFASLAALGAGLEVAVQTSVASGATRASEVALGYAIAVPTSVFLVLFFAIHAPLVPRLVVRPQLILPAAVAVLLVPLAAGSVGLPAVIVCIAMICAALVAFTLIDRASVEQ